MKGYLYHITKPEYLDSILKEGLIPGKERGLSYDNQYGSLGVFLTSNYELIIDIDTTTYENKEFVVLKVEVSDIQDELIIDDNYDIENDLLFNLAWYYPGSISSDRISIETTIKEC